jgi:hypothetical protein
MKDEPTISIPQQAAPDSAAVRGPAAAREFGNTADPAADRAAPTVAPDLTAPSVSAVPMEPLDIRALLHPAEHSRPADGRGPRMGSGARLSVAVPHCHSWSAPFGLPFESRQA